jgi:hypothetical protein
MTQHAIAARRKGVLCLKRLIPGAVGIGILLLGAWYFAVPSPVVQADFTSLHFPPKGHIEVASLPGAKGSLNLVCDDQRNFRFLLTTRMPGPRDDLRPGTYTATIFIGDIKHKLEMPVDLVGFSAADTLVSAPLSSNQLGDLTAWLGKSPPQQISFMTMERGVFLFGVADEGAVRGFASNCATISKS